ncbi:hypothetical protein ACDY97_22620 [Rhizobium mongolense]|uniref:hypothetical protein n=1 Tax=Rhizobium TaxID=379 RepID=UPI001890667D|nr:hypothetical protein [Rhizobium sp. 007]QPB19694.1 hypothetical protein ISN39_19455 [Rhizobium sp. 007]
MMGVRGDLFQKVVAKTPDHQPATLEMHGHIASVIAAMDAATAMEKRFQAEKHNDYLEKLAAGKLDTEAKQEELLQSYLEEFDQKQLAWQSLQVCLVAGA